MLFPRFPAEAPGWIETPFRAFARPVKQLVADEWSTSQLLSLTKRGVIRRDIDSGHGKYPSSFDGYQLVEKGDLVLCLFDVEETPRTVGLAMERGMITAAYTRYQLNSTVVDSKFVEWLLVSLDDQKRFKPFYSGLRNTIPKDTLAASRFGLPVVEEQRRIAEFLDRETAQIDALIAKQQQLISTLTEREESIVDSAITARTDDPRERQVVDDPWIVDLPEGWSLVPLKYLVSVDNSGIWGEDDEASGLVPCPVATTRYISASGVFDVAEMPVRWVSRAERTRYLAQPGDIVVVKSSGSAENVVSGKAGLVRSQDTEFLFSNFLMRLTPHGMVDAEYVYLVLRAGLTRERVKRMVSATTYPNLRVGEYLSAGIPLPNLDVQRLIVNRVSRALLPLREASRSAAGVVTLLRERREALISAAVTGKIDLGAGSSS